MELYTHLPVSGYGEENTESEPNNVYRQNTYKKNGYKQDGYKLREFGGWDRSYHPGGDSPSEAVTTQSYTTEPRPELLQVNGELRESRSAPPPGDRPTGDSSELGGADGGEKAPESRHRRHRHHHGRHHHRMRLHDSNVRRLLDVRGPEPSHNVRGLVDVGGTEPGEVPCTCEGAETAERLGHWGSTGSRTAPTPARPQPKPKKPPQNRRMRHPYRGGSAGMYHVPPEEDSFRFRHYEDTGLYIKQYRQEHTICIQGADPTRPPVLGRDTPDPYLAKLQQCGDLLERLMALTAMARQHAELEENSRLQDRSLTKAVQSERASRELSSPDLCCWNQTKTLPPRKAVNLAPIRDCRLSVKNIQFPQKRPPNRQAAHIQQQQLTQQPTQQHSLYNHPLPTELQTPRVAFPLPVRIVVNSESLRGNKLTTLSPPHTPTTRRRRLSRSESTEHQNQRPANPINNGTDTRFAKKRSEGDIRCPQLSTASGSDLSIYDQYLVQRNKMGVKEDTTGHLLFAPVTKEDTTGPLLFAPVTKGLSCGSRNRRKEVTKPPAIGLCEVYSST